MRHHLFAALLLAGTAAAQSRKPPPMLEALKVSLSHVENGSKADSGPREVILPNGPQEMEPTRSSRTPSRKRSAVPLQGTERTTRHRGG